MVRIVPARGSPTSVATFTTAASVAVAIALATQAPACARIARSGVLRRRAARRPGEPDPGRRVLRRRGARQVLRGGGGDGESSHTKVGILIFLGKVYVTLSQ